MIIGLTGPICAGKDEVARLLAECGFERLSLSDELRSEMRAQGIEVTRTALQDYGDLIRRREGTGAWARRVIAKIKPGVSYVVDSIRNPGEVEELRRCPSFFLVKVDAAPKIRFSRMIKRAREQDPCTFDAFQRMEMKDLGIGQPDYGQQHAQCAALADMTIVNEGTFEKLRFDVKTLLSSLNEPCNKP
jgi:dephospho-CoA kinase